MSAKNLRNYDKITLVVPPRRSVEDIVGQLRNEFGIAKNIKDDTTRNNVLQALANIIDYLQKYKVIPQDGLIIYAHKDKLDLQFSGKPVNINLYRCDDHFYKYMGETL